MMGKLNILGGLQGSDLLPGLSVIPVGSSGGQRGHSSTICRSEEID